MKHATLNVRASANIALHGGDPAGALPLYTAVVRAVPDDYRARLSLADALAQVGARAEAAQVYRCVAEICIDGGRPLPAIVAARALESVDDSPVALIEQVAATYGRGSAAIADLGARLNAHHEGHELRDKDIKRQAPLAELVADALAVGIDRATLGALPQHFPPTPILSALTPEKLLATLSAVTVHRLPAGHVLMKAGERGYSCYLLASGKLRVFGEDDTGTVREFATLGEGALVGEMALITGSPRLASVDVVEPADVIELGPEALAAMGEELDQLAPALDKMAQSRWMRNLLENSPIFSIFEPDQRQDILKRCSAHEVPKGTVLVPQGEKAKGLYMLLRGEIVLSRLVVPDRPPVRAPLAAGAVAGVDSVLKDQPSETTATTIAPSTILFLSRRFVRRLVEAVPEFADAVRRVAEHRDRMTKPPM